MTAQALADFLLARIAEDELRARDFEEAQARSLNGEYGTGGREWAAPMWFGAKEIGFLPARVLAEVAAKRRIVEMHRDGGESQGYLPGGYGDMDHACTTCGSFGEYGEPWPCDTLRALAQPHVDHPDFREEWRA